MEKHKVYDVELVRLRVSVPAILFVLAILGGLGLALKLWADGLAPG